MSWETVIHLTQKHDEQGKVFIRLINDGDKVIGAFVGDPHAREVHWTGESYEPCSAESCPHCAKGERTSLRVMINFYVPEEKAMKVIEGGATWFKDVLKVRDKYGLAQWLFEIERHGEKGSSKTTYSILPESKIDAELAQTIKQIDHHDLKAFVNSPQKEQTGLQNTVNPFA